jgi:hypothetical protein
VSNSGSELTEQSPQVCAYTNGKIGEFEMVESLPRFEPNCRAVNSTVLRTQMLF